MSALELWCLAIIALFVVVRARLDVAPAAFLGRLALLALGAWIGEDTCIRWYGFYAYTPEVWTLWADVTPVLVPMIWPVVIHSAWDLARHLLGARHAAVPLAAAGLVVADAAFIEPIAVQAGLWHWTQPGLLAVPPVGVLGWACFALVAFVVLQRAPADRLTPRTALGLLVVAPAGCHALLLALWWGVFRWLNQPVPPWPAVGVAAAVSVALTVAALRTRARHRVPRAEMLLRVPAAGFFVVLLLLEDAAPPALLAWSACFVGPYLACVDLAAPIGPRPRGDRRG